MSAGPFDSQFGSDLLSDLLFGTSRADWIDGLGGADSLLGNAGRDVLLGGQGDDGDDTLTDLFGANSADGGAGNDSIVLFSPAAQANDWPVALGGTGN